MGWKLSGKVFYCVTVRICEAYTEWDIRLTQLLRKLFAKLFINSFPATVCRSY